MNVDETYREKAKRELHKNVTSYIEQLLEAVPLRYQREFRPCCDPAVVKLDEPKKLCLTTQRIIIYCTCR